MAKKLDLNKTVYELTQEYPELIEIMACCTPSARS